MQVEMEPLIRVFFADSGSMADLRATLVGIEAQTDDSLARLGAMAVNSAAGNDAFPERRATNAIAMELWVRLHETVRDWSLWAQAEIDTWPPERRRGRDVAAGAPERGNELFAAIAARLQ